MIPIFLIGGAVALLVAVLLPGEREVPDHRPDEPPVPGKTGWKKVDALLGELRKASESSQIPLGLLVGWIAKESGGRLDEVTKLDERGYFQLMPSESKSLNLDHQRLSTDSVYSINAGLLLIAKYMRAADALGVAAKGTPYYWRLVKLGHTMGSGDAKKIVEGARAAGQTGSWEALEAYALGDHPAKTKHSPKKWFPLVDKVYEVGRPFGFGSEATAIAGEGARPIPDVLDVLDEYRKRGTI